LRKAFALSNKPTLSLLTLSLGKKRTIIEDEEEGEAEGETAAKRPRHIEED